MLVTFGCWLLGGVLLDSVAEEKGATRTLSGIVQDTEGVPLDDILIRISAEEK